MPLLIVVWLVAFVDAAHAQAVPEGVHGESGAALDGLVAAVIPFGFAGQLLAVRNGEIVVHRAYGMADRAAREWMTTETVIGIASMSKQFTAAAALKLAQEGRLSLDDPIERWLDGVPDDKRRITIDQLLTHTAGVQVGLAEDFEAQSQDEQVGAILAASLVDTPGTRWRYSNGGYILAAAIVEAAAGMPYDAHLRRALFEPAGMMHTGFLDAPPAGAPIARAYVGWEEMGAVGEWRQNWRAFGSGDLVSTAADLWRWEIAIREGRILRDEWRERYFTPQVEAGGAHYAYGLFVHQGDNGTVVEHGGDTRIGYNGGFFRYVDHDAVLIVLSNAQLSPGRWMRHVVSADLERILLREAPRYAPPPARLATPDETRALVGTYAVGNDRLHVISDGTQLWVAAAGQSLAERLHAGDIGEHALDVANRKLEVLLGGLQRGVSDAYRTALTEEGLPHLESYMAEWERLTRALGPFERFEALGSLPLRDVVEATAQLRFRDGWVTMTYLWDQGGRGRLRGTNLTIGRRFPIAVPAAIASADTIVIHDPWRETTLRLAIEAGGLRFADGARAIRVGAVAWRP